MHAAVREKWTQDSRTKAIKAISSLPMSIVVVLNPGCALELSREHKKIEWQCLTLEQLNLKFLR